MNRKNQLFAQRLNNACPAYVNLQRAENSYTQAGREHCEDLWNDFYRLADNEFLTEFPAQLHQRWFEMYLTVSLIRLGLDVECPKPGPDILIRHGDDRIWVEAVCATSGEAGRPDSVPNVSLSGEETAAATHVPQDQIVLRLRNSLDEKSRKYQRYIERGIVAENDITAVAMNVRAVPSAWADMDDYMMRALYGVGNIVVSINRDTGEITGSERQHQPIVSKVSGAEIGTLPFIDQSMEHISAVIGSSSDAVNLHNQLGGDLRIYPNLSPTTNWAERSINLGEEWSFSETDEIWNGKKTSHLKPDL